MTTLDRVHPYVERLFDDAEVHDHLERAAANLRAARGQAKRKKRRREVVTDRTVHARVLRFLAETADAGIALRQGPAKRRRRSRRLWLFAITAAATVGYLGYDESARTKLMAALGSRGAEET